MTGTNGDESEGALPGETTYRKHVRRLDRLARDLTGGKWDGASGMWQWQLALLALQREIQADITALKKHGRNADQNLLSWLQDARWHSRRLGDAFAWLTLGLNGHALAALAENHRVPIAEDSYGTDGATNIAMHLCAEGWGFPVLHDVTDCLRIGDITFVDVQTRTRRLLRTIEVKTRFLGEGTDDAGERIQRFEVQVHHFFQPGEAPPGVKEAENSVGLEVPIRVPLEPVPRVRRDRLERQRKRMARALTKQNARPGELTDLEGEDPLLAIDLTVEHASHWLELRRVIRKARRDGFAAEVIDGAFIYLALYRREGISDETVTDDRLVTAVNDSGIFDRAEHRTLRYPNSLVLTGIPPTKDRGDSRWFMPHFLFSVPHRAISDMLHRRLFICVITNPAKVVDALEEAGFTIHNESGRFDLGMGSMVATEVLRDLEGNTWTSKIENLGWNVLEVIHEFKSLGHIVASAVATRDAGHRAIAERNSITWLDSSEPA